MSAYRCGNTFMFGMFKEASAKIAEMQGEIMPFAVSPKAYKMLQRIKKKHPHWKPLAESEIWYKAYSMGLLEDEE